MANHPKKEATFPRRLTTATRSQFLPSPAPPSPPSLSLQRSTALLFPLPSAPPKLTLLILHLVHSDAGMKSLPTPSHHAQFRRSSPTPRSKLQEAEGCAKRGQFRRLLILTEPAADRQPANYCQRGILHLHLGYRSSLCPTPLMRVNLSITRSIV